MNQTQTTNINKRTLITKGSIFENCQNCIYIKTCLKFENCEYLQPKEQNKITLTPRSLLSTEQNTNSKHKRKMPYGKNNTGDDKTTLHRYHAHIVNEALSAIRAGKTAYLYTKLVLNDVFTFEPNIEINLYDGIFYVHTLNN